MSRNYKLLSVLVVIALLITGFVLWNQGILKIKEASLPEAGEIPPPATSLGASLYQESQNPIDEELQNTNPFEKSYQNPFE